MKAEKLKMWEMTHKMALKVACCSFSISWGNGVAASLPVSGQLTELKRVDWLTNTPSPLPSTRISRLIKINWINTVSVIMVTFSYCAWFLQV